MRDVKIFKIAGLPRRVRLAMTVILISGLTTSLSGCLFGSDGYIHNRENGYLQAKTIAPTQLPSNVSTGKLETTYPVPSGTLPTGTTPISIVPPGMPTTTPKDTAAPAILSSQMLNNAQVPTLKVNTPYNRTWTTVNAQLAPLGYQVLGSDKQTGIIEVKATRGSQVNEVYQFNLEKYKASTLITILDQQGQPADNNVAQVMLEQLGQQLNK